MQIISNKKVDVPVWVFAKNEDAFCFAARMLDIFYDNVELQFVMDAELTAEMRSQEYERSGIRYIPTEAVAMLVRTPNDTYD